MEESTQIGRWTVAYDAVTTRRLYSATEAWDCTCTDCENFRAVGLGAFSPALLALLKKLGIDPLKPAELCHIGDTGQEMPTQGWFHFVGRIQHGEDAWRPVSATGSVLEAEEFSPGEEIGFSNDLALVPEPLRGHPLIQLEFAVTVPWIIGAQAE